MIINKKPGQWLKGAEKCKDYYMKWQEARLFRICNYALIPKA